MRSECLDGLAIQRSNHGLHDGVLALAGLEVTDLARDVFGIEGGEPGYLGRDTRAVAPVT